MRRPESWRNPEDRPIRELTTEELWSLRYSMPLCTSSSRMPNLDEMERRFVKGAKRRKRR